MVNKITSPITPLGEIDKINEIIDELDNIDPLPSQTGQSGKYLTTNGTVPSWADVQSLPSQTGKAGKFLQTDGTDASWESAPFRNIGEIVASTIPLTDAGLHLLDGSLIQGSGIYSAFVTYIAGLVSIYPNLFVTESAWQSAVSTYGVCGKFVYDATANTVRLPKYNSKIYTGGGTAPVIGNGMTLGLTDGITNTGVFFASDGRLENALNLYNTDVGTGNPSGQIASDKSLGLTKDPTKSGIIAQISNITTSLDGYYYIVIATSTKTDIEVDIDEIATDLNSKVSTGDLAEVQCIVEVSDPSLMPSYYYVRSDGWCVQGGYFPTTSPYGMQTVTFLKPYKDTNYNVLTTVGGYDSTSDVKFTHIGAFNKTASSFQTRNDDAYNKTWRAEGYII